MQASLTEKSYGYIRARLMDGRFVPGDRLVTRTLAESIGVSLAPVREAINRLAAEGLIEHIPGAGAHVPRPDRQNIDELYGLRDATESYAAGEAAKFINEHQLVELDDIVIGWKEIADEIKHQAKSRATKSQLGRWLDHEEQFHQILIEASMNRLLAKVIGEYRAIHLVFDVQRTDPDILTLEVAERTCSDRQDLMEALRNQDADLARRLMSDQIQKGRRTVMTFLRHKGFGQTK